LLVALVVFAVSSGFLLRAFLGSDQSFASNPLTPFLPVRIIDDFEHPPARGVWWDSDGNLVYQRNVNSDHPLLGRHAMEVVYDKAGRPWSFFAFHPHQDGTNNDFYGFTEVIVWIYSENRTSVLMKVEDRTGRSDEVEIPLLPQTWARGVLPLRNVNKHSIQNILFFVAPGSPDSTGRMFLDFLALASKDLLAYIDPHQLRTPIRGAVSEQASGSYELSWAFPGGGLWAGLYELWVDTDISFRSPIRIFTTESRYTLQGISIGRYFWKVRAWTHLPHDWGYWGEAGNWSDTWQLNVEPTQTVMILENFDGVSAVKQWWDLDGNDVYRYFGDLDPRMVAEVAPFAGQGSLYVEFRKTRGFEWSFFACEVSQQEETNDFSHYQYLSLWVYPEQPGLVLMVRLQDNNDNSWEAAAAAPREREWQRLLFNIAQASASGVDLGNVKHVMFVVQPGESSAAGTFYLDEIVLFTSEAIQGVPETPSIEQVDKVNPYSIVLHWTDEKLSGAVLYEVRESGPLGTRSYWTTTNHFQLTYRDSGQYEYTVRAWTHLPQEGGTSSSWSEKQSIIIGHVPPVIESITSYFIDETSGRYLVGWIPRIVVKERYRSRDIAGGSIRILGPGDYKWETDLYIGEDGTYYYAPWNTEGLSPGTYTVYARLWNRWGEDTAVGNVHLVRGLTADFFTLLEEVDLPVAREASSLPSSPFHIISPSSWKDLSIPEEYRNMPNFCTRARLPSFIRYYDLRWVSIRGVRREEKVLGDGWSHNFNILLFEYSDGSVEIQWGTGRVDYFVKEGDSYRNHTHRSYYPHLSKEPDGRFVVRWAGGLQYYFAPSGRITQIVDANGNTLLFEYGAHGFLSKVIGPGGATYEFHYFRNKLASVTGPDGHIVQYLYDARGRLAKVIDPEGQAWTYSYDDEGYLVKISRGTSYDLHIEYTNYFGYPQRRIVAAYLNNRLHMWRVKRDNHQNTLTVTDPNGNEIVYALDSKGFVVELRDGDKEIKLERDERGNVTRFIRQDGAAWIYQYDERDRIQTITDPLGHTTYLKWNDFDRIVYVRNAEGNEFKTDHDSRGNLMFIQDALGHITRYEYDVHGNAIRKIDPMGRVTQFSYNEDNRLVRILYPNGLAEEYTYDKRGNVTSFTNRAGETIIYEYNYRNQPVRKLLPDGREILYEYDLLGNLLSIKLSDRTIQYTYDDVGQLIRAMDWNGQVVQWEYDVAGNVVQLTYPDGFQVAYDYDRRGRVLSIRVLETGESFTFEYDNIGRRSRLTYPNGWITKYDYDLMDRLTNLLFLDSAGRIRRSFTYQYDALGNVTAVATNTGEHHYEYDPMSQLVRETSPSGYWIEYVYDSVGNRSLVKKKGLETHYEVNQMNEYTRAGQDIYEYDDNGNLATILSSHGRTLYNFDFENRLISLTLTDGRSVEYLYDPLGRRIRELRPDQVVNYVWAGHQVIAELDGSERTVRRLIWGPNLDELLMVSAADAGTYYCFNDRLGSVVMRVTPSGVTEFYEYDGFGYPVNLSLAESEADERLYLFKGKQYDLQTDLYYYRARYYDPNLGRFLSPDPIASIYENNLYTYVYNNPVNLVDPFGLNPQAPEEGLGKLPGTYK